MTDNKTSSRSLTRMTTVAIVCAVVGIVLVIVSTGFGWHGFGGGLAIGAGVGLALFGMYYWGFGNGMRRGGAQNGPKLWRPSEGSAK